MLQSSFGGAERGHGSPSPTRRGLSAGGPGVAPDGDALQSSGYRSGHPASPTVRPAAGRAREPTAGGAALPAARRADSQPVVQTTGSPLYLPQASGGSGDQ